MSTVAFIIAAYFCQPEIYSWEKAQIGTEQIEFHAKELPLLDLKNTRLKLQTQAANDLADMIVHAAKDGVNIKINYAYRDHDLQKEMYRRNKRLAARPGKSKHEQGLAVDINGIKKDKNLKRWLKQNAANYGWIQTVRRERWHFEYKPEIYNFCTNPANFNNTADQSTDPEHIS